MSRYYSMTVRITKPDPSRINAIKEAAEFEWDTFENWDSIEGDVLMSFGEGSLYGGETEDAFADRLTRAIWSANGCFCEVGVIATYLDDLPYEEYSLDEDDYNRLMATN